MRIIILDYYSIETALSTGMNFYSIGGEKYEEVDYKKADYVFNVDFNCRTITVVKNRNLDHNILRYIINNIVERYCYLNEIMRYCDGFLFEDFKNYFVDQIGKEIQAYTPTLKTNENFNIRSL